MFRGMETKHKTPPQLDAFVRKVLAYRPPAKNAKPEPKQPVKHA